MQLLLAITALYLVSLNRGPVQVYWTIVTAYWILNYVNSRRKP